MAILVTGASRGIGQALSAAYEAAGRRVIRANRTPRGDDWRLDVTRPADFDALRDRLEGERLELLVCNAGIFNDDASADAQRAAALWAEAFAVNVTGAFLTVQACLPALRRGAGKIALIGSAMGSDHRAPGGSYAYRASKAALLNLGRNLATDLDLPVGIYHPGWVRTEMGGAGADIDVAQSVAGLMQRFDELDAGGSGCFRSFDGSSVPF
ncbi:SDR family NAD(P)-dependent oxidoreductase [uncultured Paracoccus sp.]|uniref:SDR family NAD(P)-dependent oxidoreductase n=1 Tax=uncultured Paracoccus sp. TaxID=189685 RepID=UPI0025DC6B58|nr:SDR family NAD(P)-dependent oxidoreductase [uncultured Paracoccus sp.]